jgi:O-antigen/teichoic acid export membrane protein
VGQSNKKSFVESIIQTFIGTIFGFCMAFVVFPLCGVEVSVQQVSGITFVFMIIGVFKNYGIRRMFNYFHIAQKKHHSLIESTAQTVIGTIVSFLSSLVIYPMFGIGATVYDITWITLLFTLFSIVKNYLVRRYHENNKLKTE